MNILQSDIVVHAFIRLLVFQTDLEMKGFQLSYL